MFGGVGMKTNGNDAVSPTHYESGKAYDIYDNSLTKRELFAAMAMQGMQSNISYTTHYIPEQKAQLAVMNADALIAELNKEVQS